MGKTEKEGVERESEKRQSAFVERLRGRWNQGRFVCVGLDTSYMRIPQVLREGRSVDEAVVEFNLAIVEATHDLVCAYKLNSAYYEAMGMAGYGALQRTIGEIHARYPEITVILDAKRGDIESTSAEYAEAVFDRLEADAVTVQPYLGREALLPFLEREDKGVIVLCRTSNPGAGEFQDLNIYGEPLYMRVARAVAEEWNRNGNCALVVGATYPEELAAVRRAVPEMPFLIPGVGTQGGEVGMLVRLGQDENGQGMMINSSRKVIYASDKTDFALCAREEVLRMDAIIRTARERERREVGVERRIGARWRLAESLYEIGAVRFGEYKLKFHDEYPDAPLSPIYVDLRALRRFPEAKRWAVLSLEEVIEDLEYDLLADVPTASSFLVSSLCDRLRVGMVTPRMKEKKHGTGQRVDGELMGESGKKVLLIDDLVTRADSKIEAAGVLRGQGFEVGEVAVLLDREQGGGEQLAAHDMRLRAVLGLGEVLEYYLQIGLLDGEQYRRVREGLGAIDNYFAFHE